MMNCTAKTQTGQPCKMPPVGGTDLCFTHSPDTRAAQAQARKLGGQNRYTPHAGDPEQIAAQIATVQDVRTLLDYVRDELMVMDNSIPRARAILAVVEVYMRSLEVGELEARIAALEERTK